MTLWIILTVLVAVVVALLTIPLVRRYDRPTGGGEATRVYRDQLAEIDAQQAGGTVSHAEAEALRIEAKRRLLAEDRFAESPPRPLGGLTLGRIAMGLAVFVAVGGTLLYDHLGTPEIVGAPGVPAPAPAPSQAQAAASQAAAAADGEQAALADMAGKIEDRLKAEPADPVGWRMLGWTRYALGQYPAAAEAYAESLKLDPKQAETWSAYGETLVLVGGGRVTPEAQAAFTKAVAADPADPRARYFLGLAKDQAGDRASAIADWVALLNSAPPGAPWEPDLRRATVEAAAASGINLEGRLKPAAAPAPTAAPGPDAAQIAAAQQMDPADQQAMIAGMVDRLAERLKSNPQDPDGWLRLIRARMVMGDPAAAAQARAEALTALTDPAARTQVSEGAKALGVPGA